MLFFLYLNYTESLLLYLTFPKSWRSTYALNYLLLFHSMWCYWILKQILKMGRIHFNTIWISSRIILQIQVILSHRLVVFRATFCIRWYICIVLNLSNRVYSGDEICKHCSLPQNQNIIKVKQSFWKYEKNYHCELF